MTNICQPINSRYHTAMIVVFGEKYMNSIIVDTEKTAMDCIQYIKEKMWEPETFLPLDSIQVKPLKERLR